MANRISLPSPRDSASSVAKPKTQRGKKTRQQLIDAAIRLIGEQGLAATRVDDIAQAVGCAHGTFYKYFDSKIDLVRQVMKEVLQELHEASLVPITPDSSIEAFIRLGVTRLADATLRHGPTIRTLSGAIGLDPVLLEYYNSLIQRDIDELTCRINALEAAGYPQIAEPRLVAFAINSMADQMTRRWLYQEQISKEEFVDIFVSLIETILLGKRPEQQSTR